MAIPKSIWRWAFYDFASDYFHSQKIPLVILFGTMVFGYLLIWKVARRIA